MAPKRNNKNSSEKLSVQTSKGPIEGKTYFYNNGKSKYYGFNNIPYARLPVGDLRFADPQDFETLSEITQLRNIHRDEYNRCSPEDYLYLNIYTPELRPQNSDQHYTRPVIVFVPTFFPVTFPDGTEAAEFLLAEDVVLVVLFYRPDILGFSGFAEKNEEFDNISGYAGLKDIVKGFEYVKKEIRNFGGCPDNVTAYGQGLSCAYIRFLTVQPYYQQTLFHRMILSSSLEHNIKHTSHLRQYDLRDVAKAIRENADDVCPDPKFEDDKTCVEYLRKLSHDELIVCSDKMNSKYKDRIVQKNNLLKIEGDLYEVQMPVLIGFNSAEGINEQIVNFSRPTSPDDCNELLEWLLLRTQTASSRNEVKQKAANVMKFYESTICRSGRKYGLFWLNIDSEMGYAIGILMLARNLAREMDPENVYLYDFMAHLGLNRTKQIYPNCPDYEGAAHGDELGYIFNFGTCVKRNSDEYRLVKRMCGIWARFARTGNPNPVKANDAHYWRPIGKQVNHYLGITSKYEDFCEFTYVTKVIFSFWESIYGIKFFSGPARESQLKETDAEQGENAETGANNKYHSEPEETLVRRYIIEAKEESRGSVTAHTSKGSIKGDVYGYNKVVYFSFQHVPYAQVPIGNLRFAAPKDISSFEEVKLQLDEYGRYGPEDNLFLHIYTREVRPKASRGQYSRPVIVFVPGRLSAKAEQYRSEELYGPQFLLQQDVVLVVLSFRNDILGFTSFSEPNAELDVPIDAGVQDLIKGFLFVKNEIQHFGGCPSNITAYGQGTGATYVRFLAARYPEDELFCKMILSSSMEHATAVELPKPLYGVHFLVEQFLDKNIDMDDRACIKFLRELSIERLLEYDYPLFGEQPNRVFVKANLLAYSEESYKMKMPVLIGYNSMEGLLERYMSRKKDKQLELARSAMVQLRSVEKPERHEKAMVAELTNVYDKIVRFYDARKLFYKDMIHSDINYTIGTAVLATHLARAMAPEPVFFYRFAVELQYNFTTNLYDSAGIFGDNTSQGAAHADELGYIFKTPFTKDVDAGSYEDLAIKRMTTLWAEFARTGDPNPKRRNKELFDVTWKCVGILKKKLTHVFHINTRHVEYKQIPEVELNRFKFWQDVIGLNFLTIPQSETEKNNDRLDATNLVGNTRRKVKQEERRH